MMSSILEAMAAEHYEAEAPVGLPWIHLSREVQENYKRAMAAALRKAADEIGPNGNQDIRNWLLHHAEQAP